MASLLAIYGDTELCKTTIKVIFISVDVIKHSEAHLTSKNRSLKNLLSCLEALYIPTLAFEGCKNSNIFHMQVKSA